jgi:glycosyltransferase involved in cell wall biosynthesis
MLLAIVPAYNEQAHIGSVVRNLLQQTDAVIVVDDGSSDRTAVEARAAGARVIRHELNRGQGAALETGHEYARRIGADMAVHFDADGQFDPADIPGAIAALREKKADILLGSRFLDGRSDVPFMKRAILLPLARWGERLLTGFRLTDAHNGFRILTAKALSRIRLRQDRMAHATEMVLLAKRANLAIIEYPVKVLYREYGQGSAGGLRIIRELLFGTFLK